MTTVVVSEKFEVVIPQEICKALGISAGQRLLILPNKGHIILVPVIPIEQARGILKGIDTTIEEEPDRI